MKRNRVNGIRGLWNRLRGRAGRVAGQVAGELMAEGEAREPIDFSAPSIPYYADLAARFSLARIVLYMILLVFVVVTIISNRHLITYANLYYLAKDINAATVTAQSTTGYFNYPVSPVTPDIATFRGGLVIAGGAEVTVLSGAGKQTLSENVNYAAPCVRSGDRYFLTFGRGEANFAVYNAFGRMYHEDTAYPIYDACMGDNGAFAVVTRSQEYTSEVILYNQSMGKVAGVHLGGYVTALCMNPTGDVTAILSVEENNAVTTTKLTIVRVQDHVTTKEILLDNTLVGSAGFLSDERMALLCRDRLLLVGTDGRTVAEIPYEGGEPQHVAFGNGTVALVTSDASGIGPMSLTLYDRSGHVTNTTVLPMAGGITEMMWHGNEVYICTSDRLWRVANGGKTLSSLTPKGEIVRLLEAGEDFPLICTLAYAYYPSAADFETNG